MYIIDPSTMQIGDIVLTRNSEFQSRMINKFTRSEFSHVMLHVGHGSYMHADKNGVHSYNAQRLLLENIDDAIVLRLKNSSQISDGTWNDICNSTRKDVGARYAYSKALVAGINKYQKILKIPNNFDNPSQYCSLLIHEAYKCANIDLCPSTDLCTPGDIAESLLLSAIPTPIRKATEAEIKFAKDKTRDKISIQTKATNNIFSAAKLKISRNIHSFDDLFQHAYDNRSWDNKISKIIEKSGYLSMPSLEQRDCPWRYNYNSFQELKLQEPRRLSLIKDELSDSEREISKYESATKNYGEQYKATKLKSLKVVLKAYREMLELAYKRRILFTNLLNEYKQ